MTSYLGTRARVGLIEAGAEDICPVGRGGCGERVKFSAQTPSRFRKKVVANVYWNSEWNRIEVWHLHCYARAGYVYGVPPADEKIPGHLRPEDKAILDAVIAMGPQMNAPQLLLALIEKYRWLNAKLNLEALRDDHP